MSLFEKAFFDKFAANELTDEDILEFDKKEKSINIGSCMKDIW